VASDNPAFACKATERIGAKKVASISITFKPEAAAKAHHAAASSHGGAAPAGPSRTGKLVITCPKQTSCQWVYYLQA